MRTLLLVGIAGIAAITADGAHAGERTTTERRVIVVDGASRGDTAVYRSGDDRVPAEADYRGRGGEGGEWQGSWDARGERYDGSYYRNGDGSYGADYRDGYRDGYDAPPPPRSQEGDDAELVRICRRDDGVGGAVLGAVVGGVAGNRIAGRGNRTAGTLLGAAGGAVVGTAIDRAEDGRCRDYWQRSGEGYRYHERGGYDDRYDGRYDGRYEDTRGYEGRGYDGYDGYEQRYDGYARGGYSYGGGGYDAGYYGGGTTTIVIPGAPTIIEETETTYETVIVAPRARQAPRRVHRRAPRPRPRCVCR